MIPCMGFIVILIGVVLAAFVGFSNPAVIALIVIGAVLSALVAFANS